MSADATVVPMVWQVPAAIRVRVGREAGPQRAMLEEGHLFMILHHVPGPDDRIRRPALFWRQPDGDWKSTIGGAGVKGLSNLIASYDEQLTTLESAEARAVTADQYHQVLERIAPVVRAARGLHNALQQAREMVKTDRDLINYRDQSASIERTAELLLQDAQFGLNYTIARQAEVQAAAAHRMAITANRLNLLAAVFLPLTALASLFGMQIHSGLPDTPATWLMIGATGIFIGILISSLLTRRG